MNDTFIPTSNYSTKKWYIIDATNKPVGRIATVISTILQGKHKPDYHPSVDMRLFNCNQCRKNNF